MSFRNAKSVKIGGKFLSYGESGSGKTFFALTFPEIAVVDSEVGTAHYENKDIKLNNGKTYNNIRLVDDTSDIKTIEEDIESAMNGELEGIETFVIDSETKFYLNMQIALLTAEERRTARNGGDVADSIVSQRGWGKISLLSQKLQQAKIDLSAKGINVVSIAQETDIKDKNQNVVGVKPDMHRKVPFDYDTVLRHFTRKDKDGNIRYFAEVKKDRTEVTKQGQIIENPCYDIWKNYYEGKTDKIETAYKKDIEKSTEDAVADTIVSDEIVSEWKSVMKSVTDKDKLEKIRKFMSEKGVNMKDIASTPIEILKELLTITKQSS